MEGCWNGADFFGDVFFDSESGMVGGGLSCDLIFTRC